MLRIKQQGGGDASSLDLSAMGTMGMGGKGGLDRNSGGEDNRTDGNNKNTPNSQSSMPSFGSGMPPEFSFEGGSSPSEMPFGEGENTFSSSLFSSLKNILLIVICVPVLIAAIAFASKYKRR